MEKSVAQQLQEAEKAVAEAEKQLGPEHPELAERLQRYANLLRQTDGRKLDAVNVEARAKAIRAKLYAQEENQQNVKISTVVIKPKQAPPVTPGVYVGIIGLVIAMASLFVNQAYLWALAGLAVVLLVFDLVTTRGGGWWRALLGLVAVGSAYAAAQSLPSYMLTDASPMERFNYSAENPQLVENVLKLSEATTIGAYSFLLPADFSSLDKTKEDWGDSYEWRTPRRPDGSSGEFHLMLMQPEAISKDAAGYSLTKLATDVAVPHIGEQLELSDLTQTKPKMEELNGLYFARVDFSGKNGEKKKTGVAYIARNPDVLLVVAGADWEEDSAQTIPQMEAIVYTLNRADKGAVRGAKPSEATAPAGDAGSDSANDQGSSTSQPAAE